MNKEITDRSQIAFVFQDKSVEVFELNDVVYFNAKHIGACLDISEEGVKTFLRETSDDECKLLKNSDFPKGFSTGFRKLANRGERFLTEPGVYAMIFQSRKPEAKQFKRWVTKEVLPSIRKHGAYFTPETMQQMLAEPDFVGNLLDRLKADTTAKIGPDAREHSEDVTASE